MVKRSLKIEYGKGDLWSPVRIGAPCADNPDILSPLIKHIVTGVFYLGQWCLAKQRVNAMEKNIAKNMVNDWASDVRGADEKFIRAMVYAFDQFAEKNNAPLYNLIAIVNGKAFNGKDSIRGMQKSADGKLPKLTQFKAPFDRVLRSVLIGFSFKYKDGKVSVSVKKDAEIARDKIEALRMCAVKNSSGRYISVRSVEFLKVFPVAEKAEKAKKTAQEMQDMVAKYLAKIAEENGFDLETVKAMATAKPAKRDDDAGIAH